MRCAVVLSSIVHVPYDNTRPQSGAAADATGASGAVNADTSTNSTTPPTNSATPRRSYNVFDFAPEKAEAALNARLSQQRFGEQQTPYTADGHLMLSGSAL